MRPLSATLLTLAVVTLGGCTGMPEKNPIWSKSTAFFSQSSDMLAAQSRRLADVAGGLLSSNDQALLQKEIEQLFAQPDIDPLTRYIEAHSADDQRARQLVIVAQQRDQRCGVIARTYAGREATRDNLQRMQRGYLLSCPEDVQNFAARVKQSASVRRPAPSASPAAAAPAALAAEVEISTAVEHAVSRKQNSNCYQLFTIKNETQALSACRSIAESGDAQAQHHMASLERSRRDFSAAFAWAARSAGQQHAPGQLLLGQMYQAGEGSPKAPATAQQLMRQAADQGHMPALLALASLYAGQQPEIARYWLDQAARKGSAQAQLQLADHYAGAAGTAADHEQAYIWYSLALLNGNDQAKAGIDREEKRLNAEQLASARSRIQDGINGKWD